MKEQIKNTVYAGVGALFLTKEKLNELKNEFVEKGKLSREEGKQFVDELLARSEQAKDQVNLWVNQRVEERIRDLNLATAADVADLRRQVEELQAVLNRGSGQKE